MNNILMIAFFVFAFNLFALGQKSAPPPPPPPPPLIYKAPAIGELKEFVSEDKTFQITFPGVPKVFKQEISGAKIVNYGLYRQGSNSVVNAYDYEYELSDSEKIYQIVRDNLLKVPNTKIESEKDIKVGDLAGKEFDVLRDFNFQKIRILVSGSRLYEIKSDVTNWHILSKYNQEKVADFRNETERFFASFKILKAPEAIATVVPDDFLGKVGETEYKNTFFNFLLNFPKSWIRLEQNEIEQARNIGLETLKTEKEKTNRAFESAAKKEVIIFLVAAKNGGLDNSANLGIGVLKQPSSQITSEMVATATKDFFLTNPNFKLLEEVRKAEIGGRQFHTFALQNQTLIKQKLFITVTKGYSVTFVMSYTNPEGQTSLDEIMKSLKFGK